MFKELLGYDCPARTLILIKSLFFTYVIFLGMFVTGTCSLAIMYASAGSAQAATYYVAETETVPEPKEQPFLAVLLFPSVLNQVETPSSLPENRTSRKVFLPKVEKRMRPEAVPVKKERSSLKKVRLAAIFNSISNKYNLIDMRSGKLVDTVSVCPDYIPLCPIQEDGMNITSGYGNRRHPIHKKIKFHAGYDIAVPSGTSVVAPHDLVIVYVGKKRGYGNTIVARRLRPYNEEIVFGHLSKYSVEEGDTVLRGKQIAKSGNSGASTGPHLHWEKRDTLGNHRPIDSVVYDSKSH